MKTTCFESRTDAIGVGKDTLALDLTHTVQREVRQDFVAIRVLDIPPGLKKVVLAVYGVRDIKWDVKEIVPGEDILCTKKGKAKHTSLAAANINSSSLRFVYNTDVLPKTGPEEFGTQHTFEEKEDVFLSSDGSMQRGRRLAESREVSLGCKSVATLPAIEVDTARGRQRPYLFMAVP